jgi:selenocysteine lyase/cysteine desulfurase
MKMVAIRNTFHGDWKTTLARGDNGDRSLKEGEIVTFVEEWSNFYGRWFTVEKENGAKLDISPVDLKDIDEHF